MDNLEKLATLKGQSRLDNLEKLAALGAQDIKRKQKNFKKPTAQCVLSTTMRKQA